MEDVDHFDDIDEDDSGKADGNSRTKDGVEVERKEVAIEEKETEDVSVTDVSVTDVSVTDDEPAAEEWAVSFFVSTETRPENSERY
jgi:hypothetical protein